MSIYRMNLAIIGDQDVGDSRLLWLSLLRVPFDFYAFVITNPSTPLGEAVNEVAWGIKRPVIVVPENNIVEQSHGLFIFGCHEHDAQSELSRLYQNRNKPVHVQPLRK